MTDRVDVFTTTERALGEVAAPMSASAPGPVTAPCAARPSTGFTHRDGTCRCFLGGPAPEFPDGTVRPVYRFAS